MRFKSLLTAALGSALLFAGPSVSAQKEPPAPPVPQLTVVPITVPASPALWKLSDKDTTIYLFGTVHLLPRGIDWYRGPVAKAFEESDTLVTEIANMSDPSFASGMMSRANLPEGQNLRDKMAAEPRQRYEQALAKMKLPASIFDKNKAWFAGMALPAFVMIQKGYRPSEGVETVLDKKHKARGGTSLGLETAEFQLNLFDSASEAQQLTMLDGVVKSLPTYGDLLDQMLAAWRDGKPEDLARLMDKSGSDDKLMDRFLRDRNRNWTGWIAKRMKQPGTVFIAVGAAHLAGDKSVNVMLARRGFKLTRVQ